MLKTWKTDSGYTITRIIGGRSNVFHIEADGRSILFDTSANRYRKELMGNLKQAGINEIDYLILSHVHFDHVGNAAFIKRNFNTRVVVHSEESEDLRLAVSRIPQGTNLFTKFLIKSLSVYAQKRYSFVRCEPDLVVREASDFQQDGISMYLLFTPGHTSGSMSLIINDEIALVGDAMFHVFPNSLYPPFANDKDQLVSSWEKLLNTDCRLFLPAHGREVSRELLEKCFNRRIKNSNI